MPRARLVPIDLEPLTRWLQQNFGDWKVSDGTRADLDNVFDTIVHRGNARGVWFDVLWIKVQELRDGGATWTNATHAVLEAWDANNPTLPRVWQDADFRAQRVHNLVQQLKNRIEDVSDLGIDQVTDAHFWIALVAGRHFVAARLYRAAKPQLRKQISERLLNIASPIAR